MMFIVLVIAVAAFGVWRGYRAGAELTKPEMVRACLPAVLHVEMLDCRRCEGVHGHLGKFDRLAASDDDALELQAARGFVAMVEHEARRLACDKSFDDVLFVCGETFEHLFYSPLFGTVQDRIEQSAKHAKRAVEENRKPRVAVIFCLLGDVRWKEWRIWGDKKRPAYASKYNVLILSVDELEDFKKWIHTHHLTTMTGGTQAQKGGEA